MYSMSDIHCNIVCLKKGVGGLCYLVVAICKLKNNCCLKARVFLCDESFVKWYLLKKDLGLV